MKATKENIEILKKLGFNCDMDKTRNPKDKEWYSLDNGWGFRLDAVKNFSQLFKNALKYKKDGELQ
jgi:hypothetical protein